MASDDEIITLEREFHTSIGRALNAWSEVENTLSFVFGYFAFPHNPILGSHAFWSIVSFEAKIKMCDAVLVKVFSSEEYYSREWKRINESLRKKNANRNKIAHGHISQWAGTKEDGTSIRTVSFFPYNLARVIRAGGLTAPWENESLTVKQIDEITTGFDKVKTRLFSLMSRDLIQKSDGRESPL